MSASAIVVGTASVNWGFDPLYTWVRPPTFDRMLDEMAQSGYEGTEISYNFPDDAALLHGELARRKLKAAGTFHTLDVRDPMNHEEALRAIGPVADRLQALGSDVLILSDAPSAARLAVAGRVAGDGSDGLGDAAWQSMGAGLNRVGELLAGRGMRAVFHPHVGTYVETRAEIDRLCSVTDPALVGLCPDTGHLAYAGVSPEDIFADYAERIGYVHLKDVDGEKLARVREEAHRIRARGRDGPVRRAGDRHGRHAADHRAAQAGRAIAGWMIVEQDAPRDPLDCRQEEPPVLARGVRPMNAARAEIARQRGAPPRACARCITPVQAISAASSPRPTCSPRSTSRSCASIRNARSGKIAIASSSLKVTAPSVCTRSSPCAATSRSPNSPRSTPSIRACKATRT